MFAIKNNTTTNHTCEGKHGVPFFPVTLMMRRTIWDLNVLAKRTNFDKLKFRLFMGSPFLESEALNLYMLHVLCRGLDQKIF